MSAPGGRQCRHSEPAAPGDHLWRNARTESGLPTTAEGFDIDRIVWLRAHLTQLQRAVAKGVPVRGWFHWSTMDNFEWVFGYQPKFGLFRTNMNTLKRTAKMSATFFRETARRSAVA